MATELRRLLPSLPAPAVAQCERHFKLLLEWNAVHALTTVEGPEIAASVHYLDALLPLLGLPEPKLVADLGSGTGLPGVAAAAIWPAARVILVESVAKKVSFLRSARAQVPFTNVEVLDGRCERVAPLTADLVLSRATFPWPELPGFAAPHLAPGGTLLGYVGREHPIPAEWIALTAAHGLSQARVSHYQLPPEMASRHALLAQRD